MKKCLSALICLISLSHLSGQSDCTNATILSGEKNLIIENYTNEEGYWYKFTPTKSGCYLISTCGLCDCDTELKIYTSCNTKDLVQWNGNNCGLQSSIARQLEANVPVWICLSDFNRSCNGKKVELSCTYLGQPELSINSFTPGGYWHKFIPALTGYYVISTCGLSDCDTKLSLLTSNNANDIVQWSDDNCGLQSSMTSKLEANVPVWIWISDVNSSCTAKKVELSCTYLGQTKVGTSIERPKEIDIRNLCSSISAKVSNFLPAPPKYYYEFLLYELAGTNHNDPDKYKKVRDFWNKHHHKFKCKQTTASMEEGGYIAKVAIAEPFDPFIVDLTTVYKVDVNAITNGTTILDYIDIKRIEYANNPLMLDELDRWYDLFEETGGKHARDLK